jgi:hypothetical protein
LEKRGRGDFMNDFISEKSSHPPFAKGGHIIRQKSKIAFKMLIIKDYFERKIWLPILYAR